MSSSASQTWSSPAEPELPSVNGLGHPTARAEEEQKQLREQLGTQQAGAQVPTARGVQPAAQVDALEALRQEQARLKAEYDRMEVSSCFWTSSLVGAVVHVF